MSDDYRVDGLSNDKVRAAGKQARWFLGIADADYVEVLDLEGVSEIWTVLGPKPFQLRVAPDADLPRDSGITSYDGHGILTQIPECIRRDASLGHGLCSIHYRARTWAWCASHTQAATRCDNAATAAGQRKGGVATKISFC